MKQFAANLRRTIVPVLALLVMGLGAVSCSRSSSEQRFLERAKKLIDQKQYDRAILELKNAAHQQPNSAEVYYEAGLAYLAIGDYRTAYGSLVRATELDPHHTAAQNKLAELIGSSVENTRDPQQLLEAEKRVQVVLAMVPDSGEALTALGRTEFMLGKPEDAINDLEAALQKAPQNLQAAWSLAMIRIRQKDTVGAEKALMNAAANSPKSPEAQLAVARFYLGMQRQGDAEAAYGRALNIDPKFAQALLELARLQNAQGKKDDAEKTLASLSALPDKEYKPLHAMYLFDIGRQEEGIKELEKQASADPKDREAFTRLTTAYFIAKRFPDAERVVNAALKKNPKDTTALLERSRVYLVTAKFSEAEQDLNQVLNLNPNAADAHYLLSKVFAARGDVLQARQQLSTTLDFKPDMLAARLELAEILMGQGGSKTALELLDAAPDYQKTLLPVAVSRNWALFGTGDKPALRKNIDTAVATFKRDPDLVLQDGLLKFENKDLPGARKSLEEVLAAKPDNTTALDALAKTYVVEKRRDFALRTVQQYAARQPGSAAMQTLLGEWLAQSERHDDARKSYTAALAAEPSLVRARMDLGFLEAIDGHFDAARQALGPLSSTGTPSVRASVEGVLGMIEEKAGNSAAAISHFRKALDNEPNNLVALNNLAYNLANSTDQLDEALQYAQKAKELSPNAWAVEDTIGWAFFRKGIYQSAVIHLRSAADKEPTALHKYHLAMAYVKSGDRLHGRQVYNEAHKMDPNLPEAAAASQLIASLN